MTKTIITIHGKRINYKVDNREVFFSLEGTTESEIREMQSRLCVTTEVKETDQKWVKQEYYI